MVGGMWLRRVARGVGDVVWDWVISRVGLCVSGAGVGGAVLGGARVGDVGGGGTGVVGAVVVGDGVVEVSVGGAGVGDVWVGGGGAGVGKGQWALTLRGGAILGHKGGQVEIRRGEKRDRGRCSKNRLVCYTFPGCENGAMSGVSGSAGAVG